MILVLLWDYENHKIIRSGDVIFNEKVMYKNQLQGKKQETEKQEYTVFDEITEKEIPKEPENQMYNSRSNRYLKHLQVLLEDLQG